MRVLLITNADALWTRKYVQDILLRAQYGVSILSQRNELFRDFYRGAGVDVLTTRSGAAGSRPETSCDVIKSLTPKMYSLAKYLTPRPVKKFLRRHLEWRAIAEISPNSGGFDALHFHYINTDMEQAYAPLWKDFSGKIILTYWGSDLFRDTRWRCNEALLRRASAVTFMTEELKRHFHSIYGHDYDAKLHILDFGVSVYDEIDKLNDDPASLAKNRRHFGIPQDKICLMAGYNAHPAQCHLEIIKSVARLPERLLSQIHILLQYSYNYIDDPAYYKRVEAALATLPCSWGIIRDFMDDGQTARLRAGVDIFIHAQITDALSASMLEYLYAGAVVLNGSWLIYHELETRGIRYMKFDDFSGLTELLKGVICDLPARKKEFSANRKALYELNSWAAVREKWLKLYA